MFCDASHFYVCREKTLTAGLFLASGVASLPHPSKVPLTLFKNFDSHYIGSKAENEKTQAFVLSLSSLFISPILSFFT